jgi:molybdopterin molybdotransferase
VNLRPGKPLVFGQVGGVPFFGLPGNPVSSMVTFELFVRPAMLRQGGRDDSVRTLTARLGEDVRSDGRRSYMRVTLTPSGGDVIAHLTGTQSSGALSSMVAADGLLIVPEDQTEVKAGTPMTVWLLRDFPRPV